MDELEFTVASQQPREGGAVLDFAESLNEGLLDLLRGHSVTGTSADDLFKERGPLAGCGKTRVLMSGRDE